jgi:PAS domain S-box-containing protein
MFSFITRKYTFPLIIAWSVLIAGSLFWNFYHIRQNDLEKGRIEARTLFELNLMYRKWSSQHGGVYVPVTETFKPNPYLLVPDRDVTTTQGKKLTLVNPAWMTRQVFELFNEQSSMPIVNRITSLKYLNPQNKPDAWEEKGLHAFEQGARELSESVISNGQPYLRLLKPFIAEEGCLKCHGHQGYKVGDVRGGISISIPMQPYFEAEAHERKAVTLTHFLLWIIGLGGIVVSTRSLEAKQRKISESEETYRVLFESNPHPMWVYDLETLGFLTVNDAAVQHYGYTREEFLAMTIRDIRPAEDVPALVQQAASLTGGISKSGVWRHRKKDGTVIYSEITAHTLDFSGRRAKLVMATDISERRKLEDQLRHAQKMEAVGRLAGGVAHDFNNILTAIIGYGSLSLMKTREDDPLRHNIEEILAASQRGATLTKGLLAFSRKQIINPRPVNISDIIERVGKLLVRLIGEDIRLETKLAASDLVVIADSGQIEQVLMNLATNARDSMPDGGLLRIETRLVTLDEQFIVAHNYGKAGAYAQITLTDTGTGMDAKTAEMIFEPFFTTKEMGRGTGLGLSMVYGIVKQHEGYINVYTEPGQGTAFKIYLPLAGRTQQSNEAPRDLPKPLRGGAETILVAEDDPSIRQLAKSVLEEFGYTVVEASDGEEAIEKIRAGQDRIKLLLLDVIMPKKNGKEVYDEAKKLVPGIKVLFASGYTADIIHRKGIVEEGQDFISKPLSPGELLKKIREVLEK